MLVSSVIDATFLEWLYPAGVEQPLYDVLSTPLTASEANLTVVLEGRVTSVPRDSVIEIDSELMLGRLVAGSTLTLMERSFLGTTLAAHAAGARVIIDPTYPRASVFGAVKSIVGMLYPWGLYSRGVDTTLTYDTTAVKTLPTGAKKILSILVRRSTVAELYTRLAQRGTDWIEYPEFTPPKFHLRRGGGIGQTLRIVYQKDFDLPTLESDNLDTAGVPVTLQPYLPMAIAGYLLQGKELPRVQIEEIRNLLAAQGVQVGAAMNIGQALIQTFKREYVNAERRRQSETDDTTIEWVGR